MQILRKRIWLIVILMVLFTGASMTGTYFWAKYAPSYTAVGQVAVHGAGRSEGFVAPTEGNVPQMALLLLTHAQRIMNTSTLALAAQDEELRNTRWAKGGSQADIVERLRGIVRSAAIPKTQDIRVSATTRGRDDSATIANAVMNAYIEIARDISQANLRQHIDQLNEQKRDLTSELEALRQEIDRNTRGSRVADLSDRSSTKTQELRDMNRQAIRLRSELMQVRSVYDMLLAADQQGTLLERPEIKSALYQDPVYADLLNRQTQLISQMQIFQRRYGPLHASVSETEDQLNRLAGQLAEAQRANIQSYMDRQREAVESLSQQLLEMEETIELVQADVRELFTTLDKLSQLKAREVAVSDLLNRINMRLQEARFLINVRVPISLTNPAAAPTKRSSPQYYLNIPAGFVLGAIMGLALTALLEVIDTSIKRPSDVRRRVDVPLLGIIPHVDDLDEDIPDPRLALQFYPDSPVGEAFRQVRTRLIFSSPPEQQRTLLITSPLPEDGRTTVTTNLGAALAQFGSKVLLVDANFRQPILHELFQGCPFDGLSNALVQQAAWGDLVHHVSENLHVLAAGPLPPNPAELLSSKGMSSLLAEMTEQYDHVLFDSGPCLVVTDPAVLASRTDGVLLVLRAGVNTHGVAQKARSTMTEAGGHILGAVLNGVRVMAGGYLRKNYDTFYEYRERQPALPA
ncbi:MAG: polysaccharide biosynthesis tyrosine autokinase [Planctomycetota bacterium]|jgi:capsular exopolysaccharide synthesis family protein